MQPHGVFNMKIAEFCIVSFYKLKYQLSIETIEQTCTQTCIDEIWSRLKNVQYYENRVAIVV